MLFDCFETFPFPNPDPRSVIPELEAIGQQLYEARAQYMVDTNQGLTKTYNALKNPACDEPRILELRRLHEEMDRAVLTLTAGATSRYRLIAHGMKRRRGEWAYLRMRLLIGFICSMGRGRGKNSVLGKALVQLRNARHRGNTPTSGRCSLSLRNKTQSQVGRGKSRPN